MPASDRPQKPYWEYGGNFDQAWVGTDQILDVMESGRWNPAPGDATETQMRNILQALSMAHVVTLDAEQFDALPEDPDIFTDYVPDPHLAFPIMYISIGEGHTLAGVLIGVTSGVLPTDADLGRVAIVPFWDFPEEAAWDGVPNIAVPCAVIAATAKRFNPLAIRILEGLQADQQLQLFREDSLVFACERSLAVARFLESANVDFEDTPVSRQVRRQAARKNIPIAQRVYVRSPRHRRKPDDTTEHASVDFSHRFEVRGHYKHYGPDTRLFRATKRDRPHKVIQHPKLGEVVRIWCPDFVKGPEDRPLVPKTRVYKHRDEAA